MLLSVPVGVLLLLAFLAGLASPPFEAARSAALPDRAPEDRYGPAVALSGICVQASLVLGYPLGGALLQVVEPKVAVGVNAASFLRVRAARLDPAVDARLSSGRQTCHRRFVAVRGLPQPRRRSAAAPAILLLGVTSFFGIVPEALVVPYGDLIGFSGSSIGLLAAAVPVGTIVGVVCIPSGGEGRRLLRAASLCAVITASLAAPLLWLEVDGALALVAYALAGGIFAVGVPTNVLLGTWLTRATTCVLGTGDRPRRGDGVQALGAACSGGVVASSAGVGEVRGRCTGPGRHLVCVVGPVVAPRGPGSGPVRVPARRRRSRARRTCPGAHTAT